MKEAAPGKSLSRAGVRGRLGDLGTIDNQYDIAVRYVIVLYQMRLS
jgi:hypothetical protein